MIWNPMKALRRRQFERASMDLVGAYLCGELSPAETEALNERLRTDAEFREHVEPVIWACLAARETASRTPRVDMDAAWSEFRAKAMAVMPERAALLPETLPPEDKPKVYPPRSEPTRKQRWEAFKKRLPQRLYRLNRSKRAVLIGTLLVIAIMAPGLWSTWKGKPPIRTSTVEPKGRTQQQALADGSRVTVASGSSVTYRRSLRWLRAVNEGILIPNLVTVEGVAYFDAVPSTYGAVIVSTGSALLTSLDGHFDVHEYARRGEVWVAVDSGHVRVEVPARPDIPPVIVRRGEEVVVTDTSISPPARRTRGLGWRTGTLQYRLEPFGRVLDDLAEWYALKFVLVPSQVRNQTVSISVTLSSVDAALSQVLQMTGHRFDRWLSVVLFDY